MPQTSSGAMNSGWIQFMRGCAQQWNGMTDAEKQASAKRVVSKSVSVEGPQGEHSAAKPPQKRLTRKTPDATVKSQGATNAKVASKAAVKTKPVSEKDNKQINKVIRATSKAKAVKAAKERESKGR